MRFLNFPDDLDEQSGNWECVPDIRVSNIARRDIYRPPVEPGFVSWAILWRERSGTLKLSFTEVTGDQTLWPPVMNFNAHDIRYCLKTLVSEDAGESWTDTGWQEDLDPLFEQNSDHHIRHVFELPDGRLLRNYSHCFEGGLMKWHHIVYDKYKEGRTTFTYSKTPDVHDMYYKVGSIWTSDNGGEAWNEIHLFRDNPPFFIQGIHPLRDGTIVAIGSLDRLNLQGQELGFSESLDEGKTWSDPRALLKNDDMFNPVSLGDECDFVELNDGRLLITVRTPKGCFRQARAERDSEGNWHCGPPTINPAIVHSGYPYMRRASDGTIFLCTHTSMMYSCDEGETWDNFPSGQAYYMQMAELAPGKMLTVVQRNIGDQPFPWRHDTSMRQKTFDYERVNIPRQRDANAVGALATLNVGSPADFHLALEVQLGAATGIAYNVTEFGYSFVTLTMDVTRERLGKDDTPAPQNVFLQIGEVAGGETRILRRNCIGKALEGSWVEFQLSRSGDLMKAACSLSHADVWDATYHCFRDKKGSQGAVALFTNKSTGAFRNVRFEAEALSIRENWLRPTDWMSTNPSYVSYTNAAM